DIGLQALSGALERGHDFLYVCFDNEAYMNTGIQRSSATPYGAWTTTTPVKHPKDRPKKDIVAIMAAHRISYTATASIGYPEDLIKKVKKAKESEGTKFIHIIAPCPTGWRSRPDDTIKLAKLAVETKIFPLYEVENGEVWRLTKKSKGIPVIEYLKLQGRFRHLKEEDVQTIQMNVDKEYEKLLKRCNESSNQ
ncbi:pyruvate synthase subunit beta, partial [candidate division WOR-3 bacterium]|nr:pyruvate synthase subunit beta [candidate division WOR-3 bacterium]